MIRYTNLEGIPEATILESFNAAFSEYMIPLQLTKEQFEWKLKSEHYNPFLSVGAFDGDRLVGFILHNTDNEYQPGVVYNGGTGVLKAYRGKALTRKMYDYILPMLHEQDYSIALLEVIEGNHPAHQSYLKIGFNPIRTLASYRGTIKPSELRNADIDIIPTAQSIFHFSDWHTTQTSWQNASHALNRVADSLQLFEARLNTKIVGYFVYNPNTNRIHQMAVDPNYRQKGIAQDMLQYIRIYLTENITITNVDDADKASIHLLEKSGLSHIINLFEMKMPI